MTSVIPARPGARAWRLSRRARRLTLLVHVVTSVSWIGVDLVMLVLAITGLTSTDPQLVAASYVALHRFAILLLLPVGLLALASGLLLGWGTRFGVLRYWWVVVKLILNIVLTVLVLVALRPSLNEAARESAHIDASLLDRLGQVSSGLMFPPIVSIATLLFATVLGIYKPWGRTGRGRRAVGRSDDVTSGGTT